MFGNEVDMANEVKVELSAEELRDIDAPDRRGDTALHRAVYAKQDLKVALLCESGANTNVPNIFGDSPVHAAVQTNSSRCVDLLLRAGASVALRNCTGYTPLLIAASEGRAELVALPAIAICMSTVPCSYSELAESQPRPRVDIVRT